MNRAASVHALCVHLRYAASRGREDFVEPRVGDGVDLDRCCAAREEYS